jgi:AGCS family alanine or glycine:cation symporter
VKWLLRIFEPVHRTVLGLSAFSRRMPITIGRFPWQKSKSVESAARSTASSEGHYVLILLLLAIGIFLSFGLKFISWREMPHAFISVWKGRRHDPGHEGEPTPFRTLMTSPAATVGTGNIVGVATAILMGGPGAVFWMG